MPVVKREAVLHRLETQEDDVHGIVIEREMSR